MVIDAEGKVQELMKIDMSVEGLMKAAIVMIQEGRNDDNIKMITAGISLIRATTSWTNSQLKVAEFGTKHPGMSLPMLGTQSPAVTRQ
jgi:hypothetical protein